MEFDEEEVVLPLYNNVAPLYLKERAELENGEVLASNFINHFHTLMTHMTYDVDCP